MTKLGVRVVMGIPTLSTARRSVKWIDAMSSIQMPLGSSLARVWIEDESIANARNAICQEALNMDADYLFMLGDDVIPPPNVLLEMLDKIDYQIPVDNKLQKVEMITGIYWTKCHPSEPYIWRGLLKGTYRDWHAGEFFPVDFGGCDCLLINTDVLKRMKFPWFSTDWVWEPGQKPSSIATEDYYFYSKARLVDAHLFADTSIQCVHEDRMAGELFCLTEQMPQADGTPICGDDTVLVADLGAGASVPFFGENATVITFDSREDVRPDVRCDIRHIPENHIGLYDIVHSRHVLEHFGRKETAYLVQHWAKLLKQGGKLIIEVPNLSWAFEQIQNHTEFVGYAWDQLYGGQNYELDFHKNGFTVRKMTNLLRSIPGIRDISVEEREENLHAEAILGEIIEPEAISVMWDEIEERENGMGS